ncbi:MAG: hypothetical protein CL692_01305 [Cellvibrionales bacterium]|nr:hypothetical protein [Cellvibrionales bacterium]
MASTSQTRRENHDSETRQVALLSDDTRTVALIEYIFALYNGAKVDLTVINSHFSEAHLALSADLILIDRHCAQGQFTGLLETLAQLNQGDFLMPIVLLLDEQYLSDDLSQFAACAALGVKDFLLSSEMSLKRLSSYFKPLGHPKVDSNSTSSNRAKSTDDSNTQPLSGLVITAEQSAITEPEPHQPSEQAFATNAVNVARDQLHLLSIDLESHRIHLSQNESTLIAEEPDAILSIAEWLALLDEEGAKQFDTMLTRAQSFLSITQEIHCTIKSTIGQVYPIHISEIQIKENGQGRVIGISSQIRMSGDITSTSNHGNNPVHSGFDNISPTTNTAMVEREWQHIAESLPMMCLILDNKGHIVKTINSDRSSTHFFPEAQQGQTLNELFGIDSFDNYVEAINKTLNTGKAHQQTIAYTTANGTRWFDTFITKMRGDLGISRQVVWAAFDATAARQAYQELLKNHDTLTDTINDAPIVFCQKDADGRYQRVNRTFCEVFNVRAEVIAGRGDDDIFSGLTLEKIIEQDGQLFSEGGEAQFTYSDTINGQTVNIHWHKFAIKSHNTNTVESIASFGFVLQEPAVSNPATTPMPSTESLSQITPETIAPKNLAEPSGAISQDFKAIIKNIISYTEMVVAQKNPGREQRVIDYLNQVVNAGEKALSLVLEASSESNSQKQLVALELKPLVRDMVQMLQPTLPSSLNFHTDIENSQGRAMVSPAQFQRLVMQLLVSARDNATNNNSPSGAGEILLALSNRRFENKKCASCGSELNGEYLVLSVTTPSDNIDPANLKKILASANNQPTKSSNNQNVIDLTHENHGHVTLESQSNAISLQLLFERMTEQSGDDEKSDQKNRSNEELSSLSSL